MDIKNGQMAHNAWPVGHHRYSARSYATMKLTRDLKWYLSSTAFFLVPGGIQMVLFPWLIAVYLMETPIRVGIAQMAGPLPMLFLILFGGWLGDRVDQRRLSVVLVYCMIVPPLLVALLFVADLIVYELLILWVVVVGIQLDPVVTHDSEKVSGS